MPAARVLPDRRHDRGIFVAAWGIGPGAGWISIRCGRRRGWDCPGTSGGRAALFPIRHPLGVLAYVAVTVNAVGSMQGVAGILGAEGSLGEWTAGWR